MGTNHWLEAYQIQHAEKRALLRAYEDCGSITQSASRAHVARLTHYDWMESDPAYASAFADVQERYAERLEREADRRGVEGVDHPVIYQGVITGTYKEYSDNLLMFRLKGLLPDKYRERQQIEHGGNVAVRHTHRVDLSALTEEELEAYGRIAAKLAGLGGGQPSDTGE